MSYFEKCMRL